ncbi:hypothetical protein V501_05747 [Pseudogymnoascus sp. VKM F-4519 (FW-2642)]|nr:hypothetical protein V501_05747 [Pseudogymnoascus sp. VKM F-4519 (FW-2642)]
MSSKLTVPAETPKHCIATQKNHRGQTTDSYRPSISIQNQHIKVPPHNHHLNPHPPLRPQTSSNRQASPHPDTNPPSKNKDKPTAATQTNATPHDQTRRPPQFTPLHHDNVQRRHRICNLSYHETIVCDTRAFTARRPGDEGRSKSPVSSYRVLSSPTWYYQVLSGIIKSYPVSSSPTSPNALSSPSSTAVPPLSPKRKEHTLPQHLSTLTQSPPALRKKIRPSSPELAQQNKQTDRQPAYITNHSSHSINARQRHFLPRPPEEWRAR